jgi:putative AdoMet-dependent methyltransferase
MDSNKFDEWAGHYDESVARTTGYPFDGYEHVLEACKQRLTGGPGLSILDIGVGTGGLSLQLYELGHLITGLDFSEEMLRIAASRMPRGTFYEADFTSGLPAIISDRSFSYIVSTYALHHLDDDHKIAFITELDRLLEIGGQMIIGDIAFRTAADRENCRLAAGNHWDEDEWYLAAEEFMPRLNQAGFRAVYEQISGCAGVLIVHKR